MKWEKKQLHKFQPNHFSFSLSSRSSPTPLFDFILVRPSKAAEKMAWIEMNGAEAGGNTKAYILYVNTANNIDDDDDEE